jgi:hypothetical protein
MTRPRIQTVPSLVSLQCGKSDRSGVIVKRETVIRWHRAGFRFWRWKSRSRGATPKVPVEIRQLIWNMSLANPL